LQINSSVALLLSLSLSPFLVGCFCLVWHLNRATRKDWDGSRLIITLLTPRTVFTGGSQMCVLKKKKNVTTIVLTPMSRRASTYPQNSVMDNLTAVCEYQKPPSPLARRSLSNSPQCIHFPALCPPLFKFCMLFLKNVFVSSLPSELLCLCSLTRHTYTEKKAGAVLHVDEGF
jgi:hypothetical protein